MPRYVVEQLDDIDELVDAGGTYAALWGVQTGEAFLYSETRSSS